MISTNKYKKGFSLVELLVVISIIGILSTLALVSFTSAQRQTRDTQRRSDIKQYQTAIESYANNNNGIYPIHASVVQIFSICSDLGFDDSCPEDPKYDGNTYTDYYKYISDASGIQYVIFSKLESGKYWVVCSTGNTGETDGAPTTVTCPL